jgi:type IV secretion system protein VirD4
MQTFGVLTTVAEGQGGQLPRQVVCYMDEFANQGHIPNMATYISTLRSYGIPLVLVIQAFAQIRALYSPEVLATIQQCAQTKMCLPGCGPEETKYFSELCGMTTVASASVSEAVRGDHAGRSQSEAPRPLMRPEEIRTMEPDQALVVRGAQAPCLTRLMPYYRDARQRTLTQLPPAPITAVPPLIVASSPPQRRARPAVPPSDSSPQPSKRFSLPE